MLKGQLEEGVDYFVKESKQNAIEYFQKTVFYDVYTMVRNKRDETFDIYAEFGTWLSWLKFRILLTFIF